jgi:uncharacterized membrane protein
VYVGKAEVEKYPAESLQKFAGDPERYEPIYQKDGVTIFLVMP